MGVVFDLDDTILPEADYVRSGMSAVAAYCAARLSSDSPSAGAESTDSEDEGHPGSGQRLLFREFLLRDFEAGVRGNSFDRLLAAFSALQDRAGLTVAELIQIYRTHTPAVTLSQEWRELLTHLRERGQRIGLISDGPLAAQSAKVAALGLHEFCAPILLTDRWGREFWKPSPRAYQEIERIWGESGASLCYVGDNPAKDFLAANLLGWRTFRLRMPGQLHFSAEAAVPEASAGRTAANLDELLVLLKD